MKVRNHALYNKAQEEEIFVFFEYLPKVASIVCKNDSLWKGVGAPPSDLYNVLMNLAIKQYFGRSLRRSIGLIRLMKRAFKLHFKVLCFKTLSNYLNNLCVRKYLNQIIRYTSNPLRYIEKNFATDKTGEKTRTFSSWYSIRCNKEISKRDCLYVHITTGTELHSVTAIDVFVEDGKDNIIFRKHVKVTSKEFDIDTWTGDGMYQARENCTAVANAGGKPYFKIKSGVTLKPKGHPAWKEMVKESREYPLRYLDKYHQRSNVECTNSAKKRKFNDFVRSKNDIAKENECHMTWCCYNFTVLSRAYHELGLEPERFW